MYADDTIAAIATPPGAGAIGIVRVSGPLSPSIADHVFSPPLRPAAWTSHHFYHGKVVDGDGTTLDQGLAVLMRAPHSSTGEDVLELHCHGSPIVLRRVLMRVLACGARVAEPGEFTKRAFLNGRLDLAQAEAVLDMVRARTTAGAGLATRQLTGQLSKYLRNLRAQLVGLKALLEAQIDFSEEEVEVANDQLLSTTDDCIVTIQDLIGSFQRGKALRDGVRVAIIGKSNVGKSSLLNALLGEDRAIVTAIAGTTRDTIEETADFDGIPVVLTDTAGLRESGDADAVERLGMERTAAKLADAEVLLTVLDASAPLDEHDRSVLKAAEGKRQILVLNKIDLPQGISDAAVRVMANGCAVVSVSAKERLGLEALRQCLMIQVVSPGNGLEGDGPVLTNVRHRDALDKACHSLTLARESICDGRPADLVAVDVQDAIDHIGTITGTITSDEILDQIFSRFCIGK